MLCIPLGGESVSVLYDVISGRKGDAVSFIRYSGLGRLIDNSPLRSGHMALEYCTTIYELAVVSSLFRRK
jgi:hypothetical protein